MASRRIPGKWFNGPIDVEPVLTPGARGERWGDKTRVARAYTEDGVKMVRGGSGDLVVSNSRVLIDPEHVIRAGSFVTIWPGRPHERRAKVISVTRGEADGQLSHQVLNLE